LLLGKSENIKSDDYLIKNLRGQQDKYHIIKQGNEDEFEFYNLLKPIFTLGNPSGKKKKSFPISSTKNSFFFTLI